MQMEIYFPRNKAVCATYKGFTIETDQPSYGGGDDLAPGPFALFIASVGTCAGSFMLSFMQQRGISTEGAGITLKTEKDPETNLICDISLDLHLPLDFPDKYRAAIIHTVGLCTVKRHLHNPPQFQLVTSGPVV